MKFKTVAEAFNHYRTATVEEIERRAAEIKGIIERDADADITTLNIELSGLAQAKENAQQAAGDNQRSGFNPITGAGMSFERRASHEATEGDVLNSPEYRSAFFKSLLGHKLTEFEQAAYNRAMGDRRADTFADSASIAAAVPTQTLNEIVKKARTMGGIMSVCRAFNIPSKVAVPIGTPTEAANWHTEGAAVDGKKPTVTSVSFDGYEIMKVFSISEKARKMSVSAFEGYMTQELNANVMECIANALVNGTGNEQGTGILTGITWTDGTNALTFDKTKGLTYTDVVKVVATLKRGYANGAAWAMNNAALYNLFYGLVDANGRPVFIADPKNEGIGKILGFPVVIDDYIADETVLFGNFNYMGYNMPEGITVEASRESSFKKGLIDYRAMAIADCKPIVAEAFVKLTRAAS